MKTHFYNARLQIFDAFNLFEGLSDARMLRFNGYFLVWNLSLIFVPHHPNPSCCTHPVYTVHMQTRNESKESQTNTSKRYIEPRAKQTPHARAHRPTLPRTGFASPRRHPSHLTNSGRWRCSKMMTTSNKAMTCFALVRSSEVSALNGHCSVCALHNPSPLHVPDPGFCANGCRTPVTPPHSAASMRT